MLSLERGVHYVTSSCRSDLSHVRHWLHRLPVDTMARPPWRPPVAVALLAAVAAEVCWPGGDRHKSMKASLLLVAMAST